MSWLEKFEDHVLFSAIKKVMDKDSTLTLDYVMEMGDEVFPLVFAEMEKSIDEMNEDIRANGGIF